MQPVGERIRRDRINALCRLLADEVGVPSDSKIRILVDLLHWWSQPDEAGSADLEEALRTLGRSSAAPYLAKLLLNMLESGDEILTGRILDALDVFRSESEQSVPVLARLLKNQAGVTRWRVAYTLSRFGVTDDWILGQIKDGHGRLPEAHPAAKSVEQFDLQKFGQLFGAALSATSNADKGGTLESLAEYMFLSIPGLRTIGRNIRTLAEEIDLAFRNEGDGFWRNLGDPFVVECKNHSKPVNAASIRDFASKLQTKGLRGGFIITTTRLTKDAISEIRTALRDERTIVAVEREHLESLATGASELSQVLSACFYRCRLL